MGTETHLRVYAMTEATIQRNIAPHIDNIVTSIDIAGRTFIEASSPTRAGIVPKTPWTLTCFYNGRPDLQCRLITKASTVQLVSKDLTEMHHFRR